MSLKQYLGKKLGGIRLLHETVMAQDAAALLKDNRAANRAHNQRFQKQGTAPTSAADEDMGIHVGDVHNEHHYHGGDATTTTTSSKASSVLKKAAVGAALVGVGVAAPFALPAAVGLLTDKPAATAPFNDTDTDTSVEIEIE
jgi:hypothetical protein